MSLRYKAKNGESIESIAFEHGFFPYTIWEHPENAKLKELRDNMNQLAAGDEVFIPDMTVGVEAASSGARLKFKRKGVPSLYRIQLLDYDEPRANLDYRFVVDGALIEGKTDANGVLEEPILPNAQKAKLYLDGDDIPYEIDFGGIHPITEISGIQMRLANLDFYSGEFNNMIDDATEQALKEFQARFKLTVNGEIDKATIDKLSEVHDSVGNIEPAE